MGKPMFYTYLSTWCVCVCVRESIQTGNCCSYQWPASGFGEGEVMHACLAVPLALNVGSPSEANR